MENTIHVFGGSGFIGSRVFGKLTKIFDRVKIWGKNEIDLESEQSVISLRHDINESDSIIYLTSKSPAKNSDDLMYNILLTQNFVKGVINKKLHKLTVVSSDAVYGSGAGLRSEKTAKAPDSYHGYMHVIREKMLTEIDANCISFVRPSAVYGVGDPHNSYGPNRFIRESLENSKVSLIGEGNSKRDHIFVEDVAEIIVRVFMADVPLEINAVTGNSISFSELAQIIKKNIVPNLEVIFNGQETNVSNIHYDNSAIFRNLNGFIPKNINEGLDLFAKPLFLR